MVRAHQQTRCWCVSATRRTISSWCICVLANIQGQGTCRKLTHRGAGSFGSAYATYAIVLPRMRLRLSSTRLLAAPTLSGLTDAARLSTYVTVAVSDALERMNE